MSAGAVAQYSCRAGIGSAVISARDAPDKCEPFSHLMRLRAFWMALRTLNAAAATGLAMFILKRLSEVCIVFDLLYAR